MRLVRPVLCFVFAVLPAFGCARSVELRTPPGFVELEHQKEHGYAYRATTPDGVVVAVRSIDGEQRGDLAFWSNAILLQLRDGSGYALLGSEELTLSDRSKGRRFRLAHDQNGKPYLYEVSVFVGAKRLLVLEAGGEKEPFERERSRIDTLEQSVSLR